jgi:hypothetical protein
VLGGSLTFQITVSSHSFSNARVEEPSVLVLSAMPGSKNLKEPSVLVLSAIPGSKNLKEPSVLLL